MELEERKKPSRAIEDRRLIELAKGGDNKSFDRLMIRYRKSVYYMIFKMVRNAEDAEDLTQETFVKAFGSLQKFDPQYAFSTWLFKIGTNNCIDFIRKKKMILYSINESTQNEEGNMLFMQIVDPNLIPYERVLKEQRKHYLGLAIESLPQRYRELIYKRYFEELSYEEIAASLSIPLGTVKAQLHRSRELLNDALAKIVTTIM